MPDTVSVETLEDLSTLLGYTQYTDESDRRLSDYVGKQPGAEVLWRYLRHRYTAPVVSVTAFDHPRYFYTGMARRIIRHHQCHEKTCPRAPCRVLLKNKTGQQTRHDQCDAQCRPYLPHAMSVNRHVCTKMCELFRASGNCFVCMQSGDHHICNAEVCDRLVVDSETRTCALTGIVYALGIDDEEGVTFQADEDHAPAPKKRQHFALVPTFSLPVELERAEAETKRRQQEEISSDNETRPLEVLARQLPPEVPSIVHAFSLKRTRESPTDSLFHEELECVDELMASRDPATKKQATRQTTRFSRHARLQLSDAGHEHMRRFHRILDDVIFRNEEKQPIEIEPELSNYIVGVVDMLWKLIIRSPIYFQYTGSYKLDFHCIYVVDAMRTGFAPKKTGDYVIPFIPLLRQKLPKLKTVAKNARFPSGMCNSAGKNFKYMLAACPAEEIAEYVKRIPRVPNSGLWEIDDEALLASLKD